jgi:serine/threonine protein kinase/WD40 repeat protein
MGEVWLAEDSQLKRQVALKLLPSVRTSDTAYRADFEREARAAAALEHPNILPVHDFGEQPIEQDMIVTYLVTPFISGGSLRDRLRAANGPLPPTEALHYLKQAAQAIDFAHSKGVLHRDIKPANMLLQNSWLYLADFGIAKLLTSPTFAGQTHSGAGTPEFMAPEQAQRQAEPASDRYSFAVTTYQLLTGQLPFRGNPLNVLRQQVEEQPPLPRAFNPALPPFVEQLLLWGLAKRPEDRPASCKILVEALEGTWQPVPRMPSDPMSTVLAPWKQPREALSSPLYPPVAGTANQPLAIPPQPIISPGNQPAYQIAPAFPAPQPVPNMVSTPNATTYAPNLQSPAPFATTAPFVAGTPVPGQQIGIPLPPPATPSQEKSLVSRRTLLIGGISTAALAAVGGTAFYFYKRAHTRPTILLLHAPRPRPVPGPRQLIPGIPLLSLTGHTKSVTQIAWDPTGRYLATGSEDTHVLLWDIGSALQSNSTSYRPLNTPTRDWKLPNMIGPNSLGWSPDGHYIATVVLDSHVYLIDTRSSAQAQPYTDNSQANNVVPPNYFVLAWSPTSDTFATHAFNEGSGTQIDLWQVGRATGPVRTFGSDNAGSTLIMDALSWSLDGAWIAGNTLGGKALVWNVVSGQVKQVLSLADRPQFNNVHVISNTSEAWSPVEPHILAVSDLDLVYIFDAVQNRILLTLQIDEPLLNGDIHPPYAWAMAWSPNGRYLAVCYPRTPRIYIWDVQTLRQTTAPNTFVKQQLFFPTKSITNGATICVSWSPDGRYIAAGYGDSTAIVWKVDAS